MKKTSLLLVSMVLLQACGGYSVDGRYFATLDAAEAEVAKLVSEGYTCVKLLTGSAGTTQKWKCDPPGGDPSVTVTPPPTDDSTTTGDDVFPPPPPPDDEEKPPTDDGEEAPPEGE